MNRATRGIALAATIALMTPAVGAGASTAPAASRVELAPTPTPSPLPKPLLRASAVNAAQRTLDVKQIVMQRMAALSRLQPRAFTAPRSSASFVGRQQVQVVTHSGAAFTHSLNYCAQHPPEIGSVSGDVTPYGELTISGSCFGTAGTVRITGTFPYEPGGLNLPAESWTDTVVKVRLSGHAYGDFGSTVDSFTGALDQPIALRLATRRVAGGMVVVSPNLVSSPVRLNFTAKRITTRAPVDIMACGGGGEPLDPQRPDFCGESGWGAFSCDAGKCLESYHARKAAVSGEDVYSVRLGHGYVLNQVLVFGDAADLIFEPTLDPSHVTFRIRWRTVPKSDPNLVKRGLPEYADYNDGSYLFFPVMTGPDGVQP